MRGASQSLEHDLALQPWLALWRACQEEAAAAIRDAVAAANPRARLGAMRI